MSYMMQPQIILLKSGTDTSQGKGQLISNINACEAVADAVRTTLGPRGMDKLVHDGSKAVVSNDGASIMALLEIVHPAAKTLVDIAASQDAEIGDGTTSVVLLAASMLTKARQYIQEGVHPQSIIRGYRKAQLFAVDKIKEISIGIGSEDGSIKERDLLERCAGTSLNSKLIRAHKDFFSPMVVDAVCSLDKDRDVNLVGVKKITGGSVTDSFLVDGVAFKKTFSYAGFEQQPKAFTDPKILCLNVELELKNEKENAEIRIEDPDQYQSIVDAEWRIIYEKLEKCVESGAQIILSRLPIGDLATQYFADRGIFCAGRVESSDLLRATKATGAIVQTTCHGITEKVLGSCGDFVEKQIGDERYNLFTKCVKSKTSTIILRGGSNQFVEEAHRSIHDALMVVKRCLKSTTVVAGGGAIEMEVSRHLKEYSQTIEGKLQLIISAYAQALEVIPRQLCDNAGFDSTDILNKLRQKHFKDSVSGKWFGVDVENEGICDTFDKFVWEPAMSKVNSISAATEAACMILSVDETVRNPKSEGAPQQGGGGRGGAPISAAMGGQGMRGMVPGAGGRGRGRRRGGRGGGIPGVNIRQGRGGK
jgi:T-complex protein 1 subunit eta